jgi:hypothetical protein
MLHPEEKRTAKAIKKSDAMLHPEEKRTEKAKKRGGEREGIGRYEVRVFTFTNSS